jgi:hypothetical protein
MPAGVLCHDTHVTAAGVELVAWGLADGCTVVWNTRSGVVRALLRHQRAAATCVAFNDLDRLPSRLGASATKLWRSDCSVQVLVCCDDGRLRIWQLSSDAPAAAAVLPRTPSPLPGAKALGAGLEAAEGDAQELLAGKLMGGVLVAEALEFLTNPLDLAREEQRAAGQATASFRCLRRVAGTPLWVAGVDWSGGAAPGTEVRVFDTDAGAQVGRLRAAAEDNREWPPGLEPVPLGDSIALLDAGSGCATVFSVATYVPAFFPAIARAVGAPTSPGSRHQLADACGAVVGPASSEGTVAEARVKADVRRLLTGTTVPERCDTNFDLRAGATSPAKAGAKDKGESGCLKSPASLHRSPQQRSPANSPKSSADSNNGNGRGGNSKDAMSPRSSASSGSPRDVIWGNGLSFSRAGMITNKMLQLRVTAKNNALNPTHLEETLKSNLGSHKRADFEAKRRGTREAREEALSARISTWAKT